MLTIRSYGEGECTFCAKTTEGVETVWDDHSFNGFLCLGDLKRAMKMKSKNGTGRAESFPSQK